MGRLPGAAGLLGIAAPRSEWEACSTFERFTEEARQVIVQAQEEGRELGHNFIGTEHLLLGVIRECDSGAARVLREHGVSAEQARARLMAIVQPGEGEVTAQVPFTPRAKKTLELALREALSLNNNFVSPEHILLGLLREGEGVATRILNELQVDRDVLREEVLKTLPPPGSDTRLGLRRRVMRGGPRAHRLSAHTASDPEGAFLIQISPEVRRLLMSAGARALDDGRTEISVADVEEALRRRPPEAAAG